MEKKICEVIRMPFGPTTSLLSSNNQMSLGSKNKSNSVHFKDVPEVDINPQYMSSYRAKTLYINTAQPERQVMGKRNVRITAKNKPTITEDVRSHIPPEPFHVSELNSWNAISSLSPRNKMKDLSKVSEKSKALEKLKEVINFQKHNRSSSDHDISQPTSTDVMNYVHGDMGRKIAVVSAPPVYKGFNEAKTRVRSVVRLNEDETIKSTIKSSNETKRKKESAKVNVTDHRPTARKSRKTGKPTILERNQFSTTPSSWKKGKVIAERILQIPSQKNENSAPDSILRLHQPPAEEPPLSGSSQITEDHHVTDAQDIPGILSEQTRSILHDIQLTPTKQTRKPMKRRPKPTTLSAHKTKSGAGQKPPKIRHYDRDEVKHYMAGQKLARKKEMLDSMKKQKEAKERKLQQLKMLDEKRKEGRWKTHHEKTQKSYADSVDLTAISNTTSTKFERPQSSINNNSSPLSRQVPGFLEKLDMYLNDGTSHIPYEDDSIVVKINEDKDTSQRSEAINPADKELNIYKSSLTSKLDRIAALKEKSKSLQDKIAFQSQRILHKPPVVETPPANVQYDKDTTYEKIDNDKRYEKMLKPLVENVSDDVNVIQRDETNYAVSGSMNSSSSTAISSQENSRSIFEDIPQENQPSFTGHEEADSILSKPMLNKPLDNLLQVEFCSEKNPPKPKESIVVASEFEHFHTKPGFGDKWGIPSGDKHSVANVFSRRFVHYASPTRETKNQNQKNRKLQRSSHLDHEHDDIPLHESPVLSHEPVLSASLHDPVLPASLHDPVLPASLQDPVLPASLRDPVLPASLRDPVLPASLRDPVLPASLRDPVLPASKPDPVLPSTNEPLPPCDVDSLITWSHKLKQESSHDESVASSVSTFNEDDYLPKARTTHETSLKYSPTTLGQRMCLELNRFETVDGAINQINQTECVGAISLAQQETVSIGQVLQSRQLEHQRELDRLAQEAKAAAEIKYSLEKKESSAEPESEYAIVPPVSSEYDTNVPPLSSLRMHSYALYSEDSTLEGSSPDSSLSIKLKSPAGKSPVRTFRNEYSDDSKSISEDISLSVTKEPSTSSIHDDITASTSDTIHDKDDSLDTSVTFDESLTEDEIAEISRRAIVPSESQRRHQRKLASPHLVKSTSYTDPSSDEAMQNISGSHTPQTSLFGDSEFSGFNQFMSSTVQQYRLEQEVRAKHRSAMLKLREKAIKEKTEAELAWLEQQKKSFRNKGEDDKMPPIKKKKRAILLRLKLETDGIKKLRAANRAANQDYELILQHHQDINRIVQTTNQIKEKIKSSKKSSDAGHDDNQTSSNQSEDRKTPSLLDPKKELHRSLKKVPSVLDDRKLTTREKALLKRRRDAERLLEWKKKLDEEEIRVMNMEKRAISAWDGKPLHEVDKPDSKVKTTNMKRSKGYQGKDEVTTHDNSSLDEITQLSKSNEGRSEAKSADSISLASAIHSSTHANNFNKDSMESLSDESFSQTQSETEQSDVEWRVYALKEELKKCQLTAERLKKQQKKKHKEQLRAQEESLKNQIKAYNSYIRKTQTELEQEIDHATNNTSSHQPHIGGHASTKPQIRSPRKNEQYMKSSRALRSAIPVNVSSPDASPRAGSQKQIISRVHTKSKSDSDSSTRSSSRSLSFDDDQHVFHDEMSFKPNFPSTNKLEPSVKHGTSDDVKKEIIANAEKSVQPPPLPKKASQILKTEKTEKIEEEKKVQDVKQHLINDQSNKLDENVSPHHEPPFKHHEQEESDSNFKEDSTLIEEVENRVKDDILNKPLTEEIVKTIWNEILEESLDVVLSKTSPPSTHISKTVKETPSVEDSVIDNLMNSLLNDAINHALSVRHKQPENEETAEKLLDEVKQNDMLKNSESLPRPVSPIFGSSQDDEWFEEDFGISLKQNENEQMQEKDFDDGWMLNVSNPVVYERNNIQQLVHQAINSKHEHERNAGELIPASFGEEPTELFEQSVADLVHHLMPQVLPQSTEPAYSNEGIKLKKKKHSVKALSQFKSDYSKSVSQEVEKLFFPDTKVALNQRSQFKWGTLKKRDRVDLLLVNELRSDEHTWTDYDADEVTVKEQLYHIMFELLIQDTITSFNRIHSRKSMQQ